MFAVFLAIPAYCGFVISGQSSAAPADTVIAACENDFAPLCFVSEDGTPDGLSVELLREALRATGHEVSFTTTGSWEDVRDLLAEGAVQVLPLMGRNPERTAQYDFTFPYLTFRSAIVVRDDTDGITAPEDLHGRSFLVQRGPIGDALIQAEGVDRPRVTPYPEEALRALARGEYDAVVMEELMALREIHKDGFTHLRVIPLQLDPFTQEFCFAVRKGDSDLLAILNDGLASCLADGTLRSLRTKWLTALQAPTSSRITIGGDIDYPPYEYLDTDGHFTGFNVELTRAIAAEMGFEVDIRPAPWVETRSALAMGKIDAIQGMFYSPEREDEFDFTPPHSIVDHVSVVRRGFGRPPTTWPELATRQIVVMESDIMHDAVRKHGLEDQTTVVESQQAALRELASGKNDVALVARLPAAYWIAKNGWTNLEIAATPLDTTEYCFAVAQGNQVLAARLAEGLKVLEQNGEYHRIREKWLGVYEKPELSFRTVMRVTAIVVVPVVFAFLLMTAWSWTLRKEVKRRTRDLQRSQATLKTAMDHSLAGIAIARAPDGALEYVNDAGLLIRGGTRESVVNGVGIQQYVESWRILDLDGTPLPNDEVPLTRAVRFGEEYSRKFIIRRDAEDDRVVWADAAPIFDDAGAVVAGIVVFSDITEDHFAEERLRLSEQRLQEAQRVGAVGDWRLDVRTGQVSWSDEMYRLFERDPSLGPPSLDDFYSLYIVEDGERLQGQVQKAVESGEEFADEYRLLLPSGRSVTLDCRFRVTKSEAGESVELFGTAHDVTELVERRSRHAQVLEATPDAYFLIDKDRRIREANPAAARMLGYSLEELLTLTVHDIDASEDNDSVEQQACLLQDTKSHRFETRHRRKDGSLVAVELNCSLSAIGGGQIVAFARDITERKRQEEARDLTVHLLRLISQENGLHEFLSGVTTLMREWSGCEAVGIRLRDAEDYPYFETRGFPVEFVRAESELCARREDGTIVRDADGRPVLECMCGNVIAGRFDPEKPFFTAFGSFWTNSTSDLLASTSDDDRGSRTRNRCHGAGYESVALIPLRHGDETLGLLQFNDSRRGRFTEELIALFEQLSANLGLGLRQRRIAAELRASEHRFRSFVENAGDIVYSVDRSGVFTYVSPNWRYFMDEPAEFAIGRSFELYVHPEDLEKCRSFYRMVAVQGSRTKSAPYRVRAADNDWHWFVSTGSVLRDQSGRVESLVGIARDVTEERAAEQALKEEGWALEEAQRISHLGSWRYDPATQQPQWSLEMFRIFGLDPADGTPDYARHRELIHPDDWERFDAAVSRAVETGEGYFLDLRITLPKGEIRRIVARGEAETDEHGRVVQLFGTTQDVTEQKQVEEALLEFNRRFELAVSSAELGVWDWDIVANVLIWDDQMYRMYGLEPSQSPNRVEDWERMLHPEDAESAIARCEAAVRGESDFDIQFRIVRPDGSTRWLKANAAVVLDAEGRAIRMIGVNRDVTELRAAEDALRRSEHRYRSVFEKNEATQLLIDPQSGQIVDANPAACRFYHYTHEEITSRRIWDINQLGEAETKQKMKSVIEGKQAAFQFKHRIATGELRDVQVFSGTVDTGYRPLLHSIILDVTAQKKAEEARELLQAQLVQAQKLDSIGRLAGGVAHDFNNMLNVILGNAELALERIRPESPLYSEVEDILQAGRRSTELTRQLLTFARQQTIEPRRIDLNVTISAMLKMVRRLIGENIHVVWNPEKDLWPVKLDPVQVDQVVANLVVNARDAIDGAGTIVIATRKSSVDEGMAESVPDASVGDFVVIEVTDDGPGMDAETQARIFEPFFTTKAAGNGTGLGLATVYGIVRQNEGFIELISSPGEGSSFRLYFPRLVSDDVVSAPQPLPLADLRGRDTVLLVEDEKTVLKLTKRILENLGYMVLPADTPNEALRIASEFEGTIDLLVTDVVMPGMSGHELWKTFSASRPNAKCLFMSGYTAEIIARHGIVEEGVQLVQKPFTAAVLAQKVREVLNA